MEILKILTVHFKDILIIYLNFDLDKPPFFQTPVNRYGR